jgi:hypothetical protein
MPSGSKLTFDINLADPLIYRYVQSGLNDGNLSFIVSSFADASQSGPPTYPNFYTIFSALAAPDEYPLLDIEGEIVRGDVDTDGDRMPDDWENFYFSSLAQEAEQDMDSDGASNLAEYQAGSIPVVDTNLLQILSITKQPDAAELRFTFAPNRSYHLQWSDDLKNWQAITNPPLLYSSEWLAKTRTNVAYPSPVFAVWTDTNAVEQPRFYRVSIP